MSRSSKSSINIFNSTFKPPPSRIQTTKIDIKDFFNSISNNRQIKFDNVLIDNINGLIDKKYRDQTKYKFTDGNDKKILMKSYFIFIYYFIAYLLKVKFRLYKLDKIEIKQDDLYGIREETIYDISPVELECERDYEKINNDFTNNHNNNNKSSYNFKETRINDKILENFYHRFDISDLINNKYLIYKCLNFKTKINEYIIFNKEHITIKDLKHLCGLNDSSLIINDKFNLPKFLTENGDELLIELLKVEYQYPQYLAFGENLEGWTDDNSKIIIFDKIKELYVKYVPSEEATSGGNSKNKYKIYVNKKTNYAYINYNKKKHYFHKNNNKIFIQLDDKSININKKIASYNNKTNSYFIII